MDNKADDLENVLVDILINKRIDLSKEWLNCSLKELIDQFENFKQKRIQSSNSEKDRRKKSSIADGLCINALLTLMHSKHSLGKNEFEECADSVLTTSVEQASENSSPSPRLLSYFVENCNAKNLDEISSWQQSRLIYLADFFPSLLESIKTTKDWCNETEERISQIYKPVSEWRWRHTKWQAAAQIFWLDKGANVEKIKNKLLYNSKLFDLLGLEVLRSTDKCLNTFDGEELRLRNLEDLIRKANPKGVKRGRPRKTNVHSEHFFFIPLVYNPISKEVNMEALHTAIYVTVKVLKIQKRTFQEISNHLIINRYKSLISDLAFLIDLWIRGAFNDKEDGVVPKPRRLQSIPPLLL